MVARGWVASAAPGRCVRRGPLPVAATPVAPSGAASGGVGGGADRHGDVRRLGGRRRPGGVGRCGLVRRGREPWFYALDAVPQHIERWAVGADGERQTEKALRRLERVGWHFIHDLDRPGAGNVDHLAIGPGGVYVLDSKLRVSDRDQLRHALAVQLPRLSEQPVRSVVTGDVVHRPADRVLLREGAHRTATARGAGTDRPVPAASARARARATAVAARGRERC